MSGRKTVIQILAEAAAIVPFMSLVEPKACLEGRKGELIVLDERERDAFEAGYALGTGKDPGPQAVARSTHKSGELSCSRNARTAATEASSRMRSVTVAARTVVSPFSPARSMSAHKSANANAPIARAADLSLCAASTASAGWPAANAARN
jgi:hypothetical protein